MCSREEEEVVVPIVPDAVEVVEFLVRLSLLFVSMMMGVLIGK